MVTVRDSADMLLMVSILVSNLPLYTCKDTHIGGGFVNNSIITALYSLR